MISGVVKRNYALETSSLEVAFGQYISGIFTEYLAYVTRQKNPVQTLKTSTQYLLTP